jgi:UDP-N-acetylmuramoylalanine--D-glutamate ligase
VPEIERRPPLPPGPYLVVGLARSGRAAAMLLVARGERVIGIDAAHPPGVEGLAGAGVELILDGDTIEPLEQVGCVVKSPGVPAGSPPVAVARKRGLPVVGELELAWRLLPNRFCAVTGTNGKTTVAELLGEIWRAAGEPVAVAGNVGTPLASLPGSVADEATIVCEASSFQLEDSEAFAPECGVLLNASPDHLDRHAGFEDYLAAKLRIFRNQGPDDFCVYNGSDPSLAEIELGGEGRRVAFCRDPGAAGRRGCEAAVESGILSLRGEPLIETAELGLLGPHNADNAAAGAVAAAVMGIERKAIATALRRFGGVPHRLERLAELAGVMYVNDSKATNVAAAVAALRSFDSGVHAILGGSRKGGGFAELVDTVVERCAACYLIGEAAEALDRELEPAWEAGVAHQRCADLPAAVDAASRAARPGEVVLLAPACASFDAYRDFEARGEHFRELVGGLR